MKKEGFIKIFRAIEDWEWVDNPTMFYLWVRLLLMANWEDKKWCGELVERGSFLTTLSSLSEATNLSVRQIRTCLSRMENDKQIVLETTNKRTKITICKYEDYQGYAQTERQTNDTLEGKPTTHTKEGSEYSDSNESSYSSQEEKNIYNNISIAPTPVHAYAGAQDPYPPTPFPFPAPFILSSVERAWAAGDQKKIVSIKRSHLEKNLDTIAQEIGIDSQEKKSFLDWWCSPSLDNPGEIRAESDRYFDIRQRAEKWIKRNKPKDEPPKSRLEQYMEKQQHLTGVIYEIFGDSETGAANGAPVPPDDQ